MVGVYLAYKINSGFFLLHFTKSMVMERTVYNSGLKKRRGNPSWEKNVVAFVHASASIN